MVFIIVVIVNIHWAFFGQKKFIGSVLSLHTYYFDSEMGTTMIYIWQSGAHNIDT